MHETMEEFLRYLESAEKHQTARCYRLGLEQFAPWLTGQGLDALKVTIDDLKRYQVWLATEYRSAERRLLARSTQATRLAAVKAYYGWLVRRGFILRNVAKPLRLPAVRRRSVRADYLTLQEASALLQTQGAAVQAAAPGTKLWAVAYRDLALFSLAIATGRRRSGLRDLRVSDVNFRRNEIRCEHEKGKGGRVLPVIGWAMAIAQAYVTQARPVLAEPENPWLFVGELSPQIGQQTLATLVARVLERTSAQNPDLEELPAKHITPHSLRVSYAKLLFTGGCDIRSVNELMMHDRLSTTARYTPLPLEDLRRVCRAAHPRA